MLINDEKQSGCKQNKPQVTRQHSASKVKEQQSCILQEQPPLAQTYTAATKAQASPIDIEIWSTSQEYGNSTISVNSHIYYTKKYLLRQGTGI